MGGFPNPFFIAAIIALLYLQVPTRYDYLAIVGRKENQSQSSIFYNLQEREEEMKEKKRKTEIKITFIKQKEEEEEE